MVAGPLELPREKILPPPPRNLFPDSPDYKSEISDSRDVFVTLQIITILEKAQRLPSQSGSKTCTECSIGPVYVPADYKITFDLIDKICFMD